MVLTVGYPCLENRETWGTRGWAVSAQKTVAYETWAAAFELRASSYERIHDACGLLT